jgi:16S rRNA G966 N2-methylase RsmD
MALAALRASRSTRRVTQGAELSLASGQADAPRGIEALPTELAVRRSDPIYNAHAYLTKVPYSAILPFVEALTEPGDVVLDVFAGSGMTGIAATLAGRRAELRDISVLGHHIGTSYLCHPTRAALEAAASRLTASAQRLVGDVYATRCAACGSAARLSKTVWSFQYECGGCRCPITYYEMFRAAGWDKRGMRCPRCAEPFSTRTAARTGEVPVLDSIRCECSPTMQDQAHSRPLVEARRSSVPVPDAEIGADRQMFQASALRKHGLGRTSAFFSQRNLAVLAALHRGIGQVEQPDVRQKLLFAFTAILTRASKRYQWHPKRPLNASNQNYYIAPVFYEWNVYELFERKVNASLRSDDFIRGEMESRGVVEFPSARYEIGSADALDLADSSVDYVFTDPPFGSQIFYSDMNLFQEVWLGTFTDRRNEAVIDRSRSADSGRSPERYEALITGALKECGRVLKEDGWLSMVFSNSSGDMWLLLQRAIHAAGLVLEHVTLLDKGQRSVKGLASGFESVVTADLILTMRKGAADESRVLREAPPGSLDVALETALVQPGSSSPTKVYLWIITRYLHNEWMLDGITVKDIRLELARRGIGVERATGLLRAGPIGA